MRGIILAGGTGSRLFPATVAVSKQLVPVFDKPMIYYPLVTLMKAGVREICLITDPRDTDAFRRLLADGSQFGLEITYLNQDEPRGLADAYLVAEGYINGASSALVLGDNLFHGLNFEKNLSQVNHGENRIFGQRVSNASDYGVVEVDKATSNIVSIEEKPLQPKTNIAVTGLYVFDSSAPERVKGLKPSQRGELEIVDLINTYVSSGNITLNILPEGTMWLDTGTPEAMLEAANLVRQLQGRFGSLIGSPEITAYELGLVSDNELERAVQRHKNSSYGKALLSILERAA